MRMSDESLDKSIEAGLAKYPDDLEERLRKKICSWKKTEAEYTDEEREQAKNPFWTPKQRAEWLSIFEQILARMVSVRGGAK